MPVDKLAKLVGDAVRALSHAPTPRYNPTVAPVGKWLRRFENEMNEKGLGTAYNKLRQESRLRAGTFVGQDYNGNKYFEDKNAPYGAPRKSPAPLHSQPVGALNLLSLLAAQAGQDGWSTQRCPASGRSRTSSTPR